MNTEESNVTYIEDVRGAASIKTDLKALHDGWDESISDRVKRWASIGRELQAGRERHPDDPSYGAWIRDNGLDEKLSQQNRAACRTISFNEIAVLTQAKHLDSIPRTAEMFLRKVNVLREEFGQPALMISPTVNAVTAPPNPETTSEPTETTETSEVKTPETPVSIADASDKPPNEVEKDRQALYDHWDNRPTVGSQEEYCRAMAKRLAEGNKATKVLLHLIADRVRDGATLTPKGVNAGKVVPAQWLSDVIPSGMEHHLAFERNNSGSYLTPTRMKDVEHLLAANVYAADNGDPTKRLTFTEWNTHILKVRPVIAPAVVTQTVTGNEKNITINGFNLWPNPDVKYSYKELCDAIYVCQSLADIALTGEHPKLTYLGNMLAHTFSHFGYGKGFVNATQAIATKLQMPGFGSTPLLNNNCWHEGITSMEIKDVVGVSKFKA